MLKKLKTHLFPILTYVLTLLVALFWVALRVNHSGISKFLGADTNQSFWIMNLPVLVCVLMWIGFALALWGLVGWRNRRWPVFTGFVIGLIGLVGAIVVIIFGAKDYLSFILVHFWKSLAAAAALTAFALLLFFPPVHKTRAGAAVKWAVVLAAVALCVIWGYQLRPCHFTYRPVVYAVEDTYQIVFSTSDNAMAWVDVDGVAYRELYAGSAKSADRVHKITVPQEALDAAGGYTIVARQMIYRGPFGGYLGESFWEGYQFRGVDSSDGLRYVSLSDVHSALDAAAQTAKKDDLDFVVLIGDLISMVETEADAQTANKLAHAITGGEIPVIYARGNHEIKGEYAEELYKYVGSLHQSFAYTVTLGQNDVFAAVLDMGEDHEDDWWEYYGTAFFDQYRQQQTDMLDAVLADGSYQNYQYKMAICHIPVPYIDKHGYFEPYRRDWTQRLNDLGVDICLSGHKHKVFQFLPGTLEPGEVLVYSQGYAGETGKKEGGTVVPFIFPTFLVGQRSLAQTGGTQDNGYTDYLCLHTAVDFTANTQTCRYENSLGEVVPIQYPFVSLDPEWNEKTITQFVLPLE